MQSSLADKNDNNNVWGFKSERVDELLMNMTNVLTFLRRIEIIQEIDGIFCDVHPMHIDCENNRKDNVVG